jgi:hypothetical protein
MRRPLDVTSEDDVLPWDMGHGLEIFEEFNNRLSFPTRCQRQNTTQCIKSKTTIKKWGQKIKSKGGNVDKIPLCSLTSLIFTVFAVTELVDEEY